MHIHKDQKELNSSKTYFESTKNIDSHLGYEAFKNLKRIGLRKIIKDHTTEPIEYSGLQLLTVALVFSKYIKKHIKSKRVGIVLPPGAACYIANLAVTLANKSSVNLNFTSSKEGLIHSIRTSEICTIITSDKLKAKLHSFPWDEVNKSLDIKKILSSFSKIKLLLTLTSIKLLPEGLLCKLFNIKKHSSLKKNHEAALLFTSGSEAMPKGVPLTHRNILGNIEQIQANHILPETKRLLAYLPIFHSFGLTTTLWYPLIKSTLVSTTPSPLEISKIVKIIEEEKVNILIGTPTFLRPFFKKAKPDQFKSVEYVIAGAEKTPDGFAQSWEELFDSKYCEGYGLTETSPVVCVNSPFNTEDYRIGSVGKLFKGMQARIVDVETLKPLSLLNSGILQLKGINVFSGYLKDKAANKKAFKDGWFHTGDLAHFDGDGFLYIEGRLSRFSKIGGEMVSHGVVEKHIIDIYNLHQEEEHKLMVTSKPDEHKGEALVLLSTIDINMEELKKQLTETGLPNLYLPKHLKIVGKIPTLPSGKLDLKTCKNMAV